MFEEEKELTPRQWGLYNLLKSQPNKWFTEYEIATSVQGYDYTENPLHSTTKCTSIFSDKNILNAHSKTDQIIVMKNHKFKIATEEEYKEERARHIRALKKQVEFIENMDKKHYRNGQGKLLNSDLGELKPHNKQFYETYDDTDQELLKAGIMIRG